MDNFIMIELITASFAAKIKALKLSLSDDELKVFNESLEESKKSFLKLHPSLSEDVLKVVDQQFS
ncbi:MAG: hypothetical protein QM564_11610 [Bergeyella sp.]